ncbi:hypothetical protein BKA70DRAFT_1531748 [Coprinopsis sp. MPI-PUGE-AT-0042]|nr:hypothetical protein BKA70DRAFT_1531748 [Coprinopsis sp. MPI-PUGE-AT-0042]
MGYLLQALKLPFAVLANLHLGNSAKPFQKRQPVVGRLPRKLNLATYKYHAVADYAPTIRQEKLNTKSPSRGFCAQTRKRTKNNWQESKGGWQTFGKYVVEGVPGQQLEGGKVGARKYQCLFHTCWRLRRPGSRRFQPLSHAAPTKTTPHSAVADRDIFMRYLWGLAIGHKYSHGGVHPPENLSATATSADLSSSFEIAPLQDFEEGDGDEFGENEMVYRHDDDESGSEASTEVDEEAEGYPSEGYFLVTAEKEQEILKSDLGFENLFDPLVWDLRVTGRRSAQLLGARKASDHLLTRVVVKAPARTFPSGHQTRGAVTTAKQELLREGPGRFCASRMSVTFRDRMLVSRVCGHSAACLPSQARFFVRRIYLAFPSSLLELFRLPLLHTRSFRETSFRRYGMNFFEYGGYRQRDSGCHSLWKIPTHLREEMEGHPGRGRGSCRWKDAVACQRDGGEDALCNEAGKGGSRNYLGHLVRKIDDFRLLTNELPSLSSHTRKETSLASQVEQRPSQAYVTNLNVLTRAARLGVGKQELSAHNDNVPDPNIRPNVHGHASLIGFPYRPNPYEEFTINLANKIMNSFISQRSFEPSVVFNLIFAAENIGVVPSGRRGRSGSISDHSTMNIQGIVGSEVLASDELIQLLRGSPSIEPTPVSASGKRLGVVLGVIARTPHDWRTGESGLNEESHQSCGEGCRSIGVSFLKLSRGKSRWIWFGSGWYRILALQLSVRQETTTSLFCLRSLAVVCEMSLPFSLERPTLVSWRQRARPLPVPTPTPSASSGPLEGPLTVTKSELTKAPVFPEVGSKLDSPGSIVKSASNWLFVIVHIRPNDSISSNSFDKRRVRLQLATFAVPCLVQRSITEEAEDHVLGEGTIKEEGNVFITYDTWKNLRRMGREDLLYKGDEDEMSSEYTHSGQEEGRMLLGVPGYADEFGGSHNNPFDPGDARMDLPDAAAYGPGPGSLTSPGLAPAYRGSLSVSERGGGDRGFPPRDSSNLPNPIHSNSRAVAQDYLSWYMARNLLLSLVGHLKRPDAWILDEVAGRRDENDIFVTVRGVMHGVMHFVQGNHAQGQTRRSVPSSDDELLSLSSLTHQETSLASQVKHTLTILDAFRNSKSPWNDNASRHARFLSLHFTPSKGRIAGAKFITFNLDKSRLSTNLRAEERTFHIFYQFLNGATAEERDYFGLEDMSDRKLLSSSGCYRLSSATGMFLSPDDSIGMVETRASLAALGFKPKHLSSIFTLLTSILLLGNLEFAHQDEGVAQRSSQAYVTNPTVLAQAARLLGVGEEELPAVFTTRMRWIRKESVGVLLDDEQSAAQRDRCMRDLYAVLFAYITEACNHRLSASLPQPASPSSATAALDMLSQTIPVFMLDQIRTSNRTSAGTAPLVGSPYGSNSYEEFTINFADDVVNSFISQHSFEPSVGFNSILTNENVGSAVSGRRGRSGSISGHSAMNVQGVVGSEVLASDELVQLLRGNPWIEPTPVSASGKKLGGVLGVIARASHNWKTGKSGLIDESKGEAVDKKDGEIIDGVLEAFGDRRKGLFGVDESSVGLLGGSPGSGSRIKTTFFINHFSSPHPTTYSIANFVEKDADLLDVSFLTLLRGSRDGFVSRLVSGPGVATERRARDDNLVVQSQVLGRGLRDVTPILSGETYARIAEAKGKTSSAASSGPLGGSLTIAEDELTKVYEGRPGRMDPSKTYSLLAQVNQSVSEVLWAFGKVVNPPSLHLAPGGASPFEAPVLPEVGSELNSPGSIIKSVGNRLFTITHIRPNDSISPNSFDKRRVKLQLAAFALPSLVQRLHHNDWSVAIDRNVFVEHYVGRMRGSVNECMTQISRAEGWVIGKDAWWRDSSDSTSFDGETEDNVFGEGAVKEEGHVFLTYDTWKSVEDRVRAAEKDGKGGPAGYGAMKGMKTSWVPSTLTVDQEKAKCFWGGAGMSMPDAATYGPGGLTSPGLAPAYPGSPCISERGGGDRGFPPKDSNNLPSGDLKVKEAPNAVEQIPSTRTRKWWLRTVWACTWLIPSSLLSSVGRMKRPDVRLAWREKVTIFWLIFLFNGIAIFYIVVFGRLLCPEFDKAWTLDEVAGHQGENNIYIAIGGVVYDVTDFIKCNHAQGQMRRGNSRDTIEQLAGADTAYYFPPPFPLACPFLVADDTNIQLEYQNFTPPVPQASTSLAIPLYAIHTSDSAGATDNLKDPEWYKNRLIPEMKPFRKGPAIWDRNKIRAWAEDEGMQKSDVYAFLNEDIADTFRSLAGKDGTPDLQKVVDGMEDGPHRVNLNCLGNMFFVGEADSRRPSSIASLATLEHDDKCKLIVVICDSNTIGGGSDRTTPRIVLDTLGVDPKVALFMSIGEGPKALNYGKVYSGLYKFEGHVVPYMVVANVGKPTERSQSGNQGKRDSQILLLPYLNRVHFDRPAHPLELDIYHQMCNQPGKAVLVFKSNTFPYLFAAFKFRVASLLESFPTIKEQLHQARRHLSPEELGQDGPFAMTTPPEFRYSLQGPKTWEIVSTPRTAPLADLLGTPSVVPGALLQVV